MEANTAEAVRRIAALREDLGITVDQIAQATGRTSEEYQAQESGRADVSFTFLSKCADCLGVDVIELLTGENPHLGGYSVVRSGEGLSIKRREGFEYQHKAPRLKNRLCEVFVVTAPYSEEEQSAPIHLSYHEGQEFDYILEGNLRFAFEDHEETLGPGDSLLYDSGRGHGMIAIGGKPCTFIALVMKPPHGTVQETVSENAISPSII